jgi:hypothetical protein
VLRARLGFAMKATSYKLKRDGLKAQPGEVQTSDECIDDTDEVVWRHVVVDASWQHTYLISAVAIDEAHGSPLPI